MAHVHRRNSAAGLAQELNVLRLVDVHDSLGVATRVALDKALDEPLQQVSQLCSLVRAVDYGDTGLVVVLGLRAELAAKELGGVCRKARKFRNKSYWLSSSRS